jgi:hypothetical protein
VSRPTPASAALELDMPVRAAKPVAPRKTIEQEVSLELAIDPRTLIQPIEPLGASRAAISNAGGAILQSGGKGTRHPAVHDVAFDANLLAEYGDAPSSWVMTPLYAWRVLRRQRELKQALLGRREEAGRTSTELEDALVAFAQRVRPAAEHLEGYSPMLADVNRAEEALRSRDAVLAAEQDAQMGRLASVDARLTKLEADLAKAQAEERAAAAEISSAQGALSRAEAKVKRADSEFRAAQRGPDRSP